MSRKKPKGGRSDRVFEPNVGSCATQNQDKTEKVTLQPALRQIGITKCAVCKHEVAVFLTKTNRPFVNCGFCLVRIFYNGEESMRRLKKRMERVGEGVNL